MNFDPWQRSQAFPVLVSPAKANEKRSLLGRNFENNLALQKNSALSQIIYSRKG